MKRLLIVLALAAAPPAASAAADPWAGVPLAERPEPGLPNLDGVWAMPRPITALKTLDGKAPPLTAAGQAAYAKNRAALKAGEDPVAKCWMQGVPRLIYAPYPLLISQERNRINFVHETNHTFRIVTLKKPLPKVDEDLDPAWLGYSAGRWDGKTLVIDTVGFNDKTWLDYSGLPHSDKLKVTERYRLTNAGAIEGRVTIDDPEMFIRPWTTGFTLVRKPGYELKESVCVRDHKM